MTSKKSLINFSYMDCSLKGGLRKIRVGCESSSNVHKVATRLLGVLDLQKIPYNLSYVREISQYVVEIIIPAEIKLDILDLISDL